MKRLAVVAGLLIVLCVPVQGALADRPVREFVPVGSEVIAGFCSFDVLLDPTRTNLYVMTFTDRSGQVVKLIASGVFKVRLTNGTTGRSITVNISGPEHVRFTEDGSVTDVATGRWLIGFPSEGLLLLTNGRFVFGEDSTALRGTSRDVCALLG